MKIAVLIGIKTSFRVFWQKKIIFSFMRNLHKVFKPGLLLTYMVGKILLSFAGLVGLFMVLMYPGQILELLQLVVDAAHNIAKGLSNLDVPKKGQ